MDAESKTYNKQVENRPIALK